MGYAESREAAPLFRRVPSSCENLPACPERHVHGQKDTGSKYPNMKYIPQTIITIRKTETIDTPYLSTLDP